MYSKWIILWKTFINILRAIHAYILCSCSFGPSVQYSYRFFFPICTCVKKTCIEKESALIYHHLRKSFFFSFWETLGNWITWRALSYISPLISAITSISHLWMSSQRSNYQKQSFDSFMFQGWKSFRDNTNARGASSLTYQQFDCFTRSYKTPSGSHEPWTWYNHCNICVIMFQN